MQSSGSNLKVWAQLGLKLQNSFRMPQSLPVYYSYNMIIHSRGTLISYNQAQLGKLRFFLESSSSTCKAQSSSTWKAQVLLGKLKLNLES